jgi:hypothetical protein
MEKYGMVAMSRIIHIIVVNCTLMFSIPSRSVIYIESIVKKIASVTQHAFNYFNTNSNRAQQTNSNFVVQQEVIPEEVIPAISLPNTPKDIRVRIGDYVKNKSKLWYQIVRSGGELLIYPYTLKNLDLVSAYQVGNFVGDLTAMPYSDCLFSTQLWYGRCTLINTSTFRLSNDRKGVEDVWRISAVYDINTAEKCFFDGISNDRGICGIQTTVMNTPTEYALFDIVRSQKKGKKDYIDRGSKNPFYIGKKHCLNSITLHPDSDVFVCAGRKFVDADEEKKEQPLYFITRGILPKITEGKYEEKYDVPIEMWEVAEQFKKIIPITARTYVGLMQDGRIASIVYRSGSQRRGSFLEISTKLITYKRACHEGEHTAQEKCEDFFDDIARDITCKTERGSWPRFAFLNKEGYVFATDFRYGKKPILFRVGQAEKEREEYGLPWHFFYDNDTIGLEYAHSPGMLFTWPVNLDITIDVEHNCNRQHSAP